MNKDFNIVYNGMDLIVTAEDYYECEADFCTPKAAFEDIISIKNNNVEIIEDKCRSCGICARICPVNAIAGQRGQPYVVDQDTCTRCGICIESCPFDAISKH